MPVSVPTFPTVQSRKHTQNQALDLNGAHSKAALNPESRQWMLLMRNVRLRCSVSLGSPSTDVSCPKGMAVGDVTSVHNSIKSSFRKGGTMPTDCKAVLREATSSQGAMFVAKLDLAWDTIHVVDADFAGVLQTLLARFTAGSREGAEGDGEEEEEPEPAPAQVYARGSAARQAKWPPSGPALKKGTSFEVAEGWTSCRTFRAFRALPATQSVGAEGGEGVGRSCRGDA